jgi:hypothetical protein
MAWIFGEVGQLQAVPAGTDAEEEPTGGQPVKTRDLQRVPA